MKWLALLCIPALAAADKHSMRWIRAETIHIAIQGGAINRHDEARIEVSFVGAKMVVTDSGKLEEHNLYPTYSTDDVTTWANTWTGTFKIDADEGRADTQGPQVQQDEVVQRRSRQDPAVRPIDKAIKLHCIFYETNLDTQPGKPPQVEMLWNCSTENKLGHTPLPWVFGGKPACIEAADGRSGPTYRRC